MWPKQQTTTSKTF